MHQHSQGAVHRQSLSFWNTFSSCHLSEKHGESIEICAKDVKFQDDILITGCNIAEHLSNLEEVLRRLDKVGLRLKREKCVFMVPEVVFKGRRVTAAGIMSCDSKVEAIKNAPKPVNVSQLRSFLGLLNHFGSFLPQVSTVLEPWHQ